MIGYDFEIDNWWNENWIPIFENGEGYGICYDLNGIFMEEKGQLLEFWYANNDRNVIAPTLESFFGKIIDFYENKPKETVDEYFEIEEIANFPKKFILE